MADHKNVHFDVGMTDEEQHEAVVDWLARWYIGGHVLYAAEMLDAEGEQFTALDLLKQEIKMGFDDEEESEVQRRELELLQEDPTGAKALEDW